MKIQPVSVWVNGSNKQATNFNLRSIADDLKSSATFYWELQSMKVDEEGVESVDQTLSVGNLSISDPEYDSWDGSNAWIYDWALVQLNLEKA